MCPNNSSSITFKNDNFKKCIHLLWNSYSKNERERKGRGERILHLWAHSPDARRWQRLLHTQLLKAALTSLFPLHHIVSVSANPFTWPSLWLQVLPISHPLSWVTLLLHPFNITPPTLPAFFIFFFTALSQLCVFWNALPTDLEMAPLEPCIAPISRPGNWL